MSGSLRQLAILVVIGAASGASAGEGDLQRFAAMQEQDVAKTCHAMMDDVQVDEINPIALKIMQGIAARVDEEPLPSFAAEEDKRNRDLLLMHISRITIVTMAALFGGDADAFGECSRRMRKVVGELRAAGY